MARSAGLSTAGAGLADIVRLWAQALRQQPDCEAPSIGWISALRNEHDVSAPTSTIHLPAQEEAGNAFPPITPPDPIPLPTVPVTQPGRLQAPVLAVLEADFQPESALVGAEQPMVLLPALTPDDYTPLQPQSFAPWLPLAPRTRWWPALRELAPRILVGPDLPRLVDRFANGRPPRRLPRVQRRGQFRRLLVLRDARRCMRPHLRDFETVLAQLRTQPLAADMRVSAFHGLPPSVPQDVDAVLLLSDLGLSDASDVDAIAGPWATWARAMAQRGVAVQAWLPVSSHAIPHALARALACVPWHERSRFRRCCGAAVPRAQEGRLSLQYTLMSKLWPRLAIAQRIEPTLLRRARLLVGGAGQPEWEAMLWHETSEHLAGEQVLQLRPDRVARWRQAFAALSVQDQRQVWRMFTAQHAHLPRSTLIVERLIWRSYARNEAVAEVAEAVEQAKDWLRRLAVQETRHVALHWQAVQAGEAHAQHAGFLHGLILRNRSDFAFTGDYAGQYAPLAVAVGRMGQGAGVSAGDWARAMPGMGQVEPLAWLVVLRHTSEGPMLEKRIAHSAFEVPHPPNAWRALLPGRHRQTAIWQPEGQPPQWLDRSYRAEPGEIAFHDLFGVHRLELGELRRALWQSALGQDRYGVFCEVQVKTIRLRFRYIPPGTFLQGSSHGVGDDDEHPRHPVTLTQGLWLAETPCTQALWQAVMGMNPSHFKDGEDVPRRPVENVSWDDVTAFLKQLQPLLPPGCEAVLPTDSQWEYACRAGTQTEYWWGDEADDARANWNRQHGGTTPVDRYPPNPWGLYDMHGNVWEWCADGSREYAAEPARDPEGPGAGDSSVVRGGSWINHPGYARAAYRHRGPRGYANQTRGFRFALRSPVGPEARPGGPGASRRGGAAGGRTDGADAPAAEPPRRARSKWPFFRGKDQDKDTPA